ncbi:MAG: phage integrase N-terminal SAM-like domain-containing protein [bacterium]|nr:phage integrase N-terminal SAM-like domain-containing protein [bacterium]
MITNKSLIQHIPDFLNYCNAKGLKNNTQENYKNYLKKFVEWIKYKNLEGLLPYQLTLEYTLEYKLYLSLHQDKKSGKSLKKTTQNYYLIALRALLAYFVVKDIVSLPPNKVTLPKPDKSVKTVKFLNLEQVEKLFGALEKKTEIGMRDRLILELLISGGFKMRQLADLNVEDCINNKINVSEDILILIKEYIKKRNDKEKALFINYRSRKNVSRRLTPRYIEKIIKKYGEKIKLPFLITPESLRWNRHLTLFNEKVRINNPKEHKSLSINDYLNNNQTSEDHKKTEGYKNDIFFEEWHLIERKIEEEKCWLRNNIDTMPEGYKNSPSLLKCDDCILRKLSILIVSGKIEAFELYNSNKNLWDNTFIKSDEINKYHGKDWHRNMINEIYRYFKHNGYKIISEPSLNHGRADLGVIDISGKIIYVEVGTVSLYKLWYNLASMKDVNILVIPSENKILEFKKIKTCTFPF